ncbi:alpha-galactosidase [Elaeis guineensis]|uniref:alpha-galactosidase n=1 Tax=Elaeis guineensis var. tenera TaxID=51953 RepID=UPI003C6D24E1
MKASVLVVLFFTLIFYRALSVAGKERELAKLPPRGWNSYDSFSWAINEQEFLDNAEIVAQRLLPHGYEYAVVDFLWFRKNVDGAYVDSYGYDSIDEWGRPFPDPERWPSSRGGKGFKEIARKVHEMGLKFGIHVMRGISTEAVNANTRILDVDTNGAYEESGRQWYATDIGMKDKTCAWMSHGFMSVNTDLGAGRAFLRSLYRQYAEWGVDFVKLDCVFGDDLDAQEIITVSKLLEELDRPVVFSISPGSSVTPSMAEGISNYVNMYRITGDDWDRWTDVVYHFDISRDFAAVKKIGAAGLQGRSWPDLDMLPLGWLADPNAKHGPYRKCNLSLDEQKTQMTLWSMAKSPLMFGGDLRHIDEITFGLITNPTLLEINSYSTKNMEFPYVFAKEDFRSTSHASTHRFLSQVLVDTPDDKVLGLTSCSNEKAKGWFIGRDHGKLDQICCKYDMKNSDRLSYCLYKRGEEIIYKQNHREKFHLLASESMEACLDASVNRKRTASERESILLSSCRRHASQMWGLNDNGTLVNTYSGLCATTSSEKANTMTGGIRSWVATGRRGEIYLSFFNLNSWRMQISARISDLTAVLGSSFISKGSCNCKEVWSGKDFGTVRQTLSMMVEKHGCALFVLNCRS